MSNKDPRRPGDLKTLPSVADVVTPSILIITLDAIHESMQALNQLRKLPQEKKRRFAADLAMVALGVRMGYLVDIGFLQDTVLTLLISNLSVKLRCFEDVAHVFDPCTCQSFAVNIPSLRRNLPEIISESGWPSYITLGTSPTLDVHCPPQLNKIIVGLAANVSADLPCNSLRLPLNLACDVLVPLAGILLEYPVAYVPEGSGQISYLSGVPLDVYECSTVHGDPSPLPTGHLLLKFSCPCQIGLDHHAFSPTAMAQRLRDRFMPRLNVLGESAVLQVKHYITTQDRVAL